MDAGTGVPLNDDDGNTLNTMQGLQRAVDYYTRVLAPKSTPQFPGDKRQPLPPLTDLQQLVTYKIIKAVPPPPDGKKYVIEGGVVKIVAK